MADPKSTTSKKPLWTKQSASKDASDCLVSGKNTKVYMAPCTGPYAATRAELCDHEQFRLCLAEDFNPTYSSETEELITCCTRRTVVSEVTGSVTVGIACAECYDDGTGKPNIQQMLTASGTSVGSQDRYRLMVERADGVCLLYLVSVTGYDPQNTKTLDDSGVIYTNYELSFDDNFEIIPKDAKCPEAVIIRATGVVDGSIALAVELELLNSEGSNVLPGNESELSLITSSAPIPFMTDGNTGSGHNFGLGDGYKFGDLDCPIELVCDIVLTRHPAAILAPRWPTSFDVAYLCEGIEYPAGTITLDPNQPLGTAANVSIDYNPGLIALMPPTLQPYFGDVA